MRRPSLRPQVAALVLAVLSYVSSYKQTILVCKQPSERICLAWFVNNADIDTNFEKMLVFANLRSICAVNNNLKVSSHKHSTRDPVNPVPVMILSQDQKESLYCKGFKTVGRFHNWQEVFKELGTAARIRRQTGYSPRGRYRGQTQSQYLAIDGGNNKDEGKAEAHSAADSSRASVSGNSGMGQAQSQSIYDPSCDDCNEKSDYGADSLKRGPYSPDHQPGADDRGYQPNWQVGKDGGLGPGGDSSGIHRPGQTGVTDYIPGQNYGTNQEPNIGGTPGTGSYIPGGYNPGGQNYGPKNIVGDNYRPGGNQHTPNVPGQAGTPGDQHFNTDFGPNGNGQGIAGGRPNYEPAGLSPNRYGSDGSIKGPNQGLVPDGRGGFIPKEGVDRSYSPDHSGYTPEYMGRYPPTDQRNIGDNNLGPNGGNGHDYRPDQSPVPSNQLHGRGQDQPLNGNGVYYPGQTGHESGYPDRYGGPQKGYGSSTTGIGTPNASGGYKPQGAGLNGEGYPPNSIGTSGTQQGIVPGIQSGNLGPNQQAPAGTNWPLASGPYPGPGGSSIYCCVVPNNGQNINAYPNTYGTGSAQVPNNLLSPGRYGSDATGTIKHPGEQYPGPGGQYTPNNLGGQNIPGGSSGPYTPGGTGGQYIPGSSGEPTQTSGSPSGQIIPGGLGGPINPGGLVDRNIPGGSGSQYTPGVPGGQLTPSDTGRPTGTQAIPGGPGGGPIGIGGQYIPGSVGGQYPPSGVRGQNIPGGADGQNIPGGIGGQYIPSGARGQNIPGGSGGQYIPANVREQYPAGGPRGQNIPGGSGGDYIPGGAEGQYYPGGVKGQNILGHHDGQNVPGGSGGQYAPGSTGGQYTPGGTGGQYTPGGTGGQYTPGGTGVQYAPGGTGGQYTPGGTGGQYTPGGTGGQYTPGGTGQYTPGGTGGKYTPGGTGVQYSPGSTGGQYTPGGTGGQYTPGGTGGQYTPGGTGGQYIPGDLAGPTLSGGLGGPTIPGSPGQHTSGSFGEQLTPQGTSGQNTPGTRGQMIPSGTGGQNIPGIIGQHIPGGSDGQGVPGTYGTEGKPGGTQISPGGGPGGSTSFYRPGQDGPGSNQYPHYGTGSVRPGGVQYGPVNTNLGGTYERPDNYGPRMGVNEPSGQYGPGTNVGPQGGKYSPVGTGTDSGPYSTGGDRSLYPGAGSGNFGGPNGNVPIPGSRGPAGNAQGSGTNGYYPNGQVGGTGSQYGPGNYHPGGGSAQPRGPHGYYNQGTTGVNKDNNIPQNVIDPNSIAPDDDDSEAEASVAQAANGTTASASSKGGNSRERAQANVHGTYTGSGSFQAQAQITGDNKGAESEVSGGKKGASSSATGNGRNNKSQANVQLGSETGSVQTQSQSNGVMHSSNSQVQGSVKGGMADAQARGPGSTSSQAQIGFTPYKDRNKAAHDSQGAPFVGGGLASAQSSGRTGQSQSQLHGTFKYGISYNGAAQSGASLDKDAIFPNRLSFDKINVFDDNEKLINTTNIEKQLEPQDTGTTPKGSDQPTYPIPFETKVMNQPTTEGNIVDETTKDSEDLYGSHTHSDHHKSEEKDVTDEPPVLSSKSFPAPNYEPNNVEYDFTTDKEDTPPDDYDSDAGFGSDGSDGAVDQSLDSNYDEYAKDPQTHQSLLGPSRKGIDIKQTTGGNTQHILLDSLKNHDAEITQRNAERPDESKIYQPGERVPGTGGYTIPLGFTGSVKSVASKDKTYVVGSKASPSQAQTVTLTPGTGRVSYNNPRSYSQNRYVKPKDLRNLHSAKDNDNRYVSVSKSVTRDLDGENNIKKQYSHTYYTKSSSCGYFTFTCTMVSSAEGRKKVCKPKIPTNPDGTPIRC